jgi:hypothetical protein
VKLSHLVPISMLDMLPAEQTTHLALCNLILDDLTYREFYRDKRATGDTVIMDVPQHEGIATSYTAWMSAFNMLRPQVVILPDVITSAELTIRNAKLCYDAIDTADLPWPVTLMGVAHGKDDQEFIDCAVALHQLGCTRIGISLEHQLADRPAYNRRRSRLQLLTRIPQMRTTKYHLLGISETAEEFVDPLFQEFAMTADASKFAVWYLSVVYPPHPPAPITVGYPGRALFGGSMEYFDYKVDYSGFENAGDMPEYLASWNTYAEKGTL